MRDRTSLVEQIIDSKPDETRRIALNENNETNVLRLVGETSLLNYLCKMEAFLDQRDVYVFRGWDKAEISRKPVVEKFWVTFFLVFPTNSEIDEGVRRITNDKEAQNQVRGRRIGNGQVEIQMRLLKRLLDAIELQTKDQAKELASEEIT